MPHAIEILKRVDSNPHGVDINELINSRRITYSTAYETIIPLMQWGIIFFDCRRYLLSTLGRGILAAIYMVEGAAQGKDILVVDTGDSNMDNENILQIIDSITTN